MALAVLPVVEAMAEPLLPLGSANVETSRLISQTKIIRKASGVPHLNAQTLLPV